MYWIVSFLVLVVLTIIYYVGYCGLGVLSGVSNGHYFLGYGSRPLFHFRVRGILFSVGVFIPFFGLAKIYKVEGNLKKRADYSWEFFDKPLLARLVVTYSGVLSLLLVGIFSFIFTTYTRSDTFISKEEVDKYGIYPSPLAEHHGFQKGDRILTINGKVYQRFDDLLEPENYHESTFTILRNGEEISLEFKKVDFKKLRNRMFIEIWAPFEIDSVLADSPAEKINLVRGDRIVGVNGQEIIKLSEMTKAFDDDNDREVTLEIQHLNDSTSFTKKVTLNEQNRLGVLSNELIQFTEREYSLAEAIVIGTQRAFINIIYEARAIIGITAGKVKGGPIRISQAFGNTNVWQYFWQFTGTWAMWLVLWNFLPYPKSSLWEGIALVYERITRKKYPLSFFKTSLKVAWIIIGAQFLVSLFIDLAKLF